MQILELSLKHSDSDNIKNQFNKAKEQKQRDLQNVQNKIKQKIMDHKRSQNKKTSRNEQIEQKLRATKKRLISNLSQQSDSILYRTCSKIKLNQQYKQINKSTSNISNHLRQWKSQSKKQFNIQKIKQLYEDTFIKNKFMKKAKQKKYCFKSQQRQLLIQIFQHYKQDQKYISFNNVKIFLQQCKLFYLYYNIKRQNIDYILKNSAKNYGKMSLNQFLDMFFADRPNIISYLQDHQKYILKQCILTQQNWKQLKQIFNTLDTFGNQCVPLIPFIYKIKNNPSNPNLINQPAIQYPQIKRTIPLKKVIFNVENRYNLQQKLTWQEIKNIFINFKYQAQPTIDSIYRKLISQGQISIFSNYFMLNQQIIQQIKSVYYQSTKYCEYFVNKKQICKQLLDSNIIKQQGNNAIVRIIKDNNKQKKIYIEQQIKQLLKQYNQFIDLDQLLEFFTIRGPINTISHKNYIIQQYSSDSQQEQIRINQIQSQKYIIKKQQYKQYFKQKKTRQKQTTIFKQFSLTNSNKISTMFLKTLNDIQNQEKQEEEQMLKQFKANPIPAKLNPQRYKAYVQRKQREKQRKKIKLNQKLQKQRKIYQYLKSNTKLFVQKNKKSNINQQIYNKSDYIKSKQTPWFVKQIGMLQKINKQNEARKKAKILNKKLQYKKIWSKLPESMKCYQDSEIFTVQDEQSYHKNIKSKSRQVPNFKQLHKQFEQLLEKKKKAFIPTRPIQFKISKQKYSKNTIKTQKMSRVIQRDYLIKGKSVKQLKKQIKNISYNIPTTKKFQDYKKLKQNEMKQKQIQKIQKKVEEQQKKIKQQNFAKFMNKRLSKQIKRTLSLKNIIKNKKNILKYQQRQLKYKNQQQMCKIYYNVMNRPFLFQLQTKIQNSKLKKKKLKKFTQNAKNQQSKHIHESPLKAYESQIKQSQSRRIISPDKQKQPQQQDQQQNYYYLNQSF